MSRSMARAAVAEAIGTFALIFVGVLSIGAEALVGLPTAVVGLSAIALAHGLTIACMVAALGHISGGHFNPAVTLGFVVSGKLKPLDGLIYWVAQLLGATLGGLMAVGAISTPLALNGVTSVSLEVAPETALLCELIGTFFLVLVIFGTATDPRAPKHIFPLAIGLTVTLDILAIGPLTGGAVNPSRCFGPLLACTLVPDGTDRAAALWAEHWVYWVGPLAGGAAAALLYTRFLGRTDETPAPEPAE